MPSKAKLKRIDVHYTEETKLGKYARCWLNRHAKDEGQSVGEIAEVLLRHGCASGYVGELIYYHLTTKFYKRFQEDINALIAEFQDSSCNLSMGYLIKGWDETDPLAMECTNQNLLAWWGFEIAIIQTGQDHDII